jgi:hypothetical protein
MTIHRKGLATLAAVGLLWALLPGTTTGATGVTPEAATPSDFNGDGYADLAIGVAGEALGTNGGAGGVNVLYGSAAGLTAAGDQFWSQDSAGILEEGEANDSFGAALTSGDYDCDGFADLAVGAPGEVLDGVDSAGAVTVIYGSSAGLVSAGNQLWTAPVLGGELSDGARFGWALSSGDFDNDGCWDLAIGAPLSPSGGIARVGSVAVLFGSMMGLAAGRAVSLSPATPGIPGDPFEGKLFGDALAVGDFDADGADDLAVSTTEPGPAGGVVVAYGRADGFDLARSRLWRQASPGIPGGEEDHEDFGASLAAGDFDADGADDLAIGVPWDDPSGDAGGHGAVNVIYGSSGGLTSVGAQLWNQDVRGVPGGAEPGDQFGASLAAGDLNGDRADDLAIGTPWETFGSTARKQGVVNVIYGSPAGLSAEGAQFWHQNSPGVPGTAETADHFGTSLAIGNYGRSRAADLAIGVPSEDFGRIANCGMVNVLYGRSTGLSGTNAQGWSQHTKGVLGVSEKFDLFGSSLTP